MPVSLRKDWSGRPDLNRGRPAPKAGALAEQSSARGTALIRSHLPVPSRHTRHVCAFFNSNEEEYRVLIPFIKDGFNANSGESGPSELL
jgi:hypothetical protein